MNMFRARATTWLALGAAAAGIAVGAAGIAGAATGGSSSTGAAPTGAAPAAGGNPATVAHGPGETVLSGTNAAKVKAAALAAVPGGTIVRVETDSAGSPYEAHVKKADGSYVTVKVNSSFVVTATQSGFGGGPGGAQPPANGQGSGNAPPPAA